MAAPDALKDLTMVYMHLVDIMEQQRGGAAAFSDSLYTWLVRETALGMATYLATTSQPLDPDVPCKMMTRLDPISMNHERCHIGLCQVKELIGTMLLMVWAAVQLGRSSLFCSWMGQRMRWVETEPKIDSGTLLVSLPPCIALV